MNIPLSKSYSVGGIYAAAGSGLLGARNAGFNVRFNNEPRTFVHPSTYTQNFVGTFRREIDALRNEQVDLILGQPPCKRFSSLAIRKKNREFFKLLDWEIYHFLREIEERKPKFFILENLKGVLKHLHFQNDKGMMITDGFGTREEFMLEDYYIKVYQLNAKDFKFPQSRNRVFIIGSKHEDFDYRPYQNIFSGANNVEDLLSQIDSGAHNTQPANHSPERVRGFDKLKIGESYYGTQNNRRLNPLKIAPTMTSHRTQYVHPTEPRTLNVREVATMMGYPQYFKFYGSRTNQLDQAGCSVIPHIIFDISIQILKFLESHG